MVQRQMSAISEVKQYKVSPGVSVACMCIRGIITGIYTCIIRGLTFRGFSRPILTP